MFKNKQQATTTTRTTVFTSGASTSTLWAVTRNLMASGIWHTAPGSSRTNRVTSCFTASDTRNLRTMHVITYKNQLPSQFFFFFNANASSLQLMYRGWGWRSGGQNDGEKGKRGLRGQRKKEKLNTLRVAVQITVPVHISVPFIFPHFHCLLLCQALSTLYSFVYQLILHWINAFESQPIRNKHLKIKWN